MHVSSPHRVLPKLLPAPAPVKRAGGSAGFQISGEEAREMARAWHRSNPDFVIGILKQVKALKDEDPETRMLALHYIKEATEIGFFPRLI